MNINLIVVLGPTAVGKTGLAAKLASKYNGEIISADSRQVYRGMDIGTGKDLDDYKLNENLIPYHMIDILDPSEEFNLYEFKKRFAQYFSDIIQRTKIPFLVGGTALYLHSILRNYKLADADFNSPLYKKLMLKSIDELRDILTSKRSDLHNVTDLNEKERLVKAIIVASSNAEQKIELPEIFPLVIGVKLEREEIKKRITERLKNRLNEGMIDEVKNLLERGISFDKLEFFGLEYKFVGRYLKGELNYNDMFQKLNSAIHSFAKRQMTWYRKMEREGIEINWIYGADYNKAQKLIARKLA